MQSKQVVFLAAAVSIAASPAAFAAAAVKVTSVEQRGARLFIHASGKPEFTAFKLSGPPRVVIDLNGGDVTAAARQVESHEAGIAGWSGAQFDDDKVHVGRIVVALEADAKYDVAAEGNDVVLTLGEQKPAAAPAADPHLVLSREDSAEVKNPAGKLGRVEVSEKDGAAVVQVGADGEIARFDLVELKEPARLAIDLHGVAGRFGKADGAALVKGVRIARRDDGSRIVIDGQGDLMPKYSIARTARGLLVTVGEPKPPPPVAAASKAARREPSPASANPEAKLPESSKLASFVQIRAVDLRVIDGRTEVLVALDQPVKFDIARPEGGSSVLTLHGAALPDRLERNLDASSLGGAVTLLSSYRVPGAPGEVKVAATMAKGTTDELTAQKGTLIWKFSGPKAVAQVAAPAPRAAAMASDARAAAGQSSVYDVSNYTGRKVDFNVKDIDIKNLLGAISEISKKNIIVADDVKGTVTIKLRNVPWDQALDIILKSKGLGREEIGNIIRVAPIETLRNEQRAAAEAYK
ncbi:MAG TPA: AMIN domain-containing protein, partial [Myxococcales bacterium]|nr:AMIN domain-containing protein [Myxococcales bacterium]